MTDDLIKANYESLIYEIRGQKVMLDFDLAVLYGVETKRLKEQVRRNIDRFPKDFMFELSINEYRFLRSQFATLEKGQHSKYSPFAFTEQGVAMLSGILNSKQAIEVNIAIMRTFVQIRTLMQSNNALASKIEKLEKKYDEKFAVVFKALKQMIQKKSEPRIKVGYKNFEK
jgi:hypothetical protein